MILLDTTICKAVIREDRRVTSHLLRHAGRIYLPFVVSAELYFGVEKLEHAGHDAHALREAIDELHALVQGIVQTSPDSLMAYARLRAQLEAAGTPIGNNDQWIAAQALSEDALLVSDNVREFKRVPGLRLENWLK